jgi:hypothetical protein
MTQKVKKKIVTLIVFALAFVPNGSVMLYAQGQVTTTTSDAIFSFQENKI